MAGIYIHIPFCKQACSYCNFHFSTSLQTKENVLAAIQQEISLRTNYLPEREITTLYFGGGTPSLLSALEINTMIDQLRQHFSFAANMEITLEANPDDLTSEQLTELRDTPINRFSIGIQSFKEEDLRLMNRVHTEAEAYRAIEQSQQAGFHNLTIDFIYGTPTLSDEEWRQNLHTAFEMGIPHISSYALTVEPRTALDHWVKSGKAPPVDDEQAARQFEILMDEMAAHGYDHYEISNFCQTSYMARHNTSYWQGTPYLGLGPGAHSFDGQTRQWNEANNVKYAKAILNEATVPFEREEWTIEDRFNELMLTSLRTKWGCDLQSLQESFPEHFYQEFRRESNSLIKQGLLERRMVRLSSPAKARSWPIV